MLTCIYIFLGFIILQSWHPLYADLYLHFSWSLRYHTVLTPTLCWLEKDVMTLAETILYPMSQVIYVLTPTLCWLEKDVMTQQQAIIYPMSQVIHVQSLWLMRRMTWPTDHHIPHVASALCSKLVAHDKDDMTQTQTITYPMSQVRAILAYRHHLMKSDSIWSVDGSSSTRWEYAYLASMKVAL